MILIASSIGTHLHSSPLAQIWIIPQVETTIIFELSLVPSWWNITCNHIIYNIRVLGVEVCYYEECVVSQIVING